MTFWTKLQYELLCFVCAEDEIFVSAGDHNKEHSRYAVILGKQREDSIYLDNIIFKYHGAGHTLLFPDLSKPFKLYQNPLKDQDQYKDCQTSALKTLHIMKNQTFHE